MHTYVSIFISLYAIYVGHNNKFKKQNKRKKNILQLCLCVFNKGQGKVINSLKTSTKYLEHINKNIYHILFQSNNFGINTQKKMLIQIYHSLEQCGKCDYSLFICFKCSFIYLLSCLSNKHVLSVYYCSRYFPRKFKY